MTGITMGDANGVGPEIILKAYRDGIVTPSSVVIGDMGAIALCNERLGFGVPLCGVSSLAEAEGGALNVLDQGLLEAGDIRPGELDGKVAAASRAYVVKAVELALAGGLSAVCTLPVNKEAIRLTDPVFTGHTELLAELCGEESYTMMLAGEKLTVTHVSTHVSMEEAVRAVTKRRVLEVIELTRDALARFLPAPRIAVAGLNAHAGENGAFGRQELDEIAPAVEDARRAGMDAVGPLPPDTVFLRASKGEFDAVVAMYHDQGHIPMKLLDFHGGVNVTLGLRVPRTSVDHGTAFDIAWRGIADTGSFAAALRYAEKVGGRA